MRHKKPQLDSLTARRAIARERCIAAALTHSDTPHDNKGRGATAFSLSSLFFALSRDPSPFIPSLASSFLPSSEGNFGNGSDAWGETKGRRRGRALCGGAAVTHWPRGYSRPPVLSKARWFDDGYGAFMVSLIIHLVSKTLLFFPCVS